MRKRDRSRLEALARARPDALDPARLADSRRQHDDLAAVLSTTPGRARRTATSWPSRRRTLVPLAGLSVVTAIAAGAMAVSSIHAGGPGGVVSASGSTDSRLVLMDMAVAVQHQTEQGDYWQQEMQCGTLSLVDNGATPYVIAESEQQRWSVGVRPGEQSLLIVGINARTAPRGAEDLARWRAAGSPDGVLVYTGVDLHGKRFLDTIGTGHQSMTRTDYDNNIVALGDENVDYSYLQNLPSDGSALGNLLDAMYAKSHRDGTDARTEWMFDQASNIITFPVPSAVRAAAYRIIADLPGISSLGKVVDPLGRPGIGVALPTRQQGDLGAERQELIVDPATDTILSQQEVLVQPSALAATAGLIPGTALNYTATTHIGWADQQIVPPATTR